MAYDPKDPADKKIVDKMIADALAEAAEAHEADVVGLKKKNEDLVLRLKKAREGAEDPDHVTKLETELEKSQADLKAANKALKAAEKDRETFKTQAEQETTASRKLLIDNGLTEALTVNNVGKQFIPAVKKLLEGNVTIKTEGDNRTAVVGDKSLGDYVKSWSQSDEGKNYVLAPASGGGASPGGSANGKTGKTLARSAFDVLSPVEKSKAMAEGTTLTD